MTADAFDLAEQLQTPIMLMTDLDLGMNDHVTPALQWDDTREMKRGKVLTAEDLEGMEKFGRYLDVDGDGIPYRTYPATHPTKGSYFTRGTSRDEYAVYTEDSNAYQRNMERLMVKWDTAKNMVPAPQFYQQKNNSEHGMIFFGTSMYAVVESLDLLKEDKMPMDAMRLRAFPFSDAVLDFINAHDYVFVVEQNRDAQMRSLLMIELGIDPAKLIPVLNYDGMPITAQFIVKEVKHQLVSA
jgi:2-oxoglutarate ferredoxin oxidoreductase subunit alpha